MIESVKLEKQIEEEKKEELSLSSSFLARHFIYSLIVQLTQ